MSTNGSLLPNQLNIQGLEQKSFQMSVHHLKQQICFCFYFVNEKRKRRQSKTKQVLAANKTSPSLFLYCSCFFFCNKVPCKV